MLVGTVRPGLSITEGLLREVRALPEAARAQVLRRIGVIGDHVSTTAPWIVDRILAGRRQGDRITWLTTGKLLRRDLAALVGRKRDVLSRYPMARTS